IAEELTRIEDQKQNVELARHAIVEEQRSLEHDRVEMTGMRRNGEALLEVNRRSLAEAEQHIVEDRERAERHANEAATLEQSLADLARAMEAHEARLVQAEAEVNEAAQVRAGLERRAVDAQSLADRRTAEARGIERDRAQHEARDSAIETRRHALLEQAQG